MSDWYDFDRGLSSSSVDISDARLHTVGHAWLLVVWGQPPEGNKAGLCGSGSSNVCTCFSLQSETQFCHWPLLDLMTHRSPRPLSDVFHFPCLSGWQSNTGYSHMLLLLFLIHYTAHMSRFASSCSPNKQQRHSTAAAKSLWTKLLPLTQHGFNYVLENIKQVGQFVVGNHISIEGAQDITNDLYQECHNYFSSPSHGSCFS